MTSEALTNGTIINIISKSEANGLFIAMARILPQTLSLSEFL